jgi:TatD DNase family protein
MFSFSAKYVDTHCHLDLYTDVQDLLSKAENSSVVIVGVTNTPSVYFFTQNLSKQFKNVIPAIGLHPELVHQRRHELEQFWDHLATTQFVGEIGLDYVTTDQTNRQIQRDIFSQVIEKCASYKNKVLSVHSRRSASDVIKIIGHNFPGKVILHWFSGSDREAEKAIDYGYYFSFNSSMVKSKRGQTLARLIPQNRLLTETDGPFVRVNNLPVEPTFTPDIVSSLAGILSENIEVVRLLVLDNFKSLFIQNTGAHNK